MAGKEDPVRSSGAVGGGSAPAVEKVEAAEPQGVKVGSVPSAFMPRPLPAGRRKLGEKKADLVYGGLRPCSGGRAPTEEVKGKKAVLVHGGLRPCGAGRTSTEEEEEEEAADCESGGLRPCSGGHLLTVEKVKAARLSGGLEVCSASQSVAEKANKEKDAVTAAKRKAEDSKAAAAGGSSEGKPAADASVEAAAGEGEEDSEIKWVEMPEEHMRWILAQKREKHIVPPIEDYMTEYDMNSTVLSQKNIDETQKLFTRLHASLQASHYDFFEYQAWVRQEYLQYGRVLIPESCSKDELQKEINDVWAQFKEEYKRDHPDDSDTESEEDYAMVADYSVKEHVSSD